MSRADPALGLGILLAASITPRTAAKLLNISLEAANLFVADAQADLMVLQAQIAKARKLPS